MTPEEEQVASMIRQYLATSSRYDFDGLDMLAEGLGHIRQEHAFWLSRQLNTGGKLEGMNRPPNYQDRSVRIYFALRDIARGIETNHSKALKYGMLIIQAQKLW
jgi:hypothetical protein